jgi:Domain of unknown function (DUF929)
MSEQDDADVVEQVPRQFNFPAVPGLAALRGIIGTGRRRVVVIAAAGALLVAAATLATFRLTEGPRTDPALAGLITEITTVPVGNSAPGLPGLPASASSASAYSSTLLISPGTLSAVSGPPFTRGGKPEVLYVATEYCPYCAMENWPQLAAALRQPKTDLGAALLNEADSLTAEFCRLTGDRPASACPAFLRNAGFPS